MNAQLAESSKISHTSTLDLPQTRRQGCFQWHSPRHSCFPSRRRVAALRGWKASVGSTLKQHISENGHWRVRQVTHDEAPSIAALQASAFYEPLPLLGPFNKLLQLGFEAEILPQIRQKISYAPHEGFACLVAEDAHNPKGIVGVVEVGIQSGKAELKALQGQGMEELVYAYVSCMAVKSDHRRKGIASALLRAAEIQAGKWKQNWVLLHVYSDNVSGVSLYQSTGYSLIFQDPNWQKILGRRQRKLLAKGAAATGAAGAIMSISENVMRLWQQQDSPSTAPADS